MDSLVWLGLAVVAGAVEVLSPTFGFLFVAASALLVAALAWLGVGLEMQLVAFTGSVLFSVIAVRPRLAARLRMRGGLLPSRTERLLGQVGEVTSAIDPVKGGRVLVAGEDWAARALEAVPEGTKVIVDGAEGIVLNVTPES